MLIWHRADLHSMLEHDHHAGWRSVIVHDEVNMINHSAASDGGESNRVSGGYASGTQARAVCYSALEMGDESSCSAGLAQSAGPLRRIVASFLDAVLISMRRQTHAGTQCNALSARTTLAVRAFGPYGQEACRNAHRVRARKSRRDFLLVHGRRAK